MRILGVKDACDYITPVELEGERGDVKEP